jgi:hypothetical protein
MSYACGCVYWSCWFYGYKPSEANRLTYLGFEPGEAATGMFTGPSSVDLSSAAPPRGTIYLKPTAIC